MPSTSTSRTSSSSRAAAALGLCGLLALGLSAAPAAHAQALVGPGWTLSNANANGSFDTSGGPGTVTLTGGNNNSGAFGSTQYVYNGAGTGPGTFSFTYAYHSDDAAQNSSYDPAGYLLDGKKYQLTTPGAAAGIDQTGSVSVGLAQGETFGFYVDTTDNILGAGHLTIKNMSAPLSTPEPSGVAAFAFTALGAAALVLKARKRPSDGIRPGTFPMGQPG